MKLWPTQPEASRRLYIRCAWMFGGLLLAWAIAFVLYFRNAAGSPFAPDLLMFGPTFVMLVYVLIATGRILRRVLACEGVLCEACLYDMRGSPSVEVCPECGMAFDHTATPKRWARWRSEIIRK